MSSRSESVRGLMPGHACSSSMNLRGPSERSWTISGVHLVAMISAVAATAQSWSWVSFIVRFISTSLLGAVAVRYRNESGFASRAVTLVEPLAHRARTPAALVDRPDDQRLPTAGVAGGEHAVDRRRELRGIDV